ncbi:MAG: nucleotidyltransferase domain-containing protein [Planctomycetaceae bacterium]|jgi:predicted nucleotidyltransferase|nr:nucleotidyltransferase domain-containing protein [Planctomycetaceae bacterium]
MPVNEEILKIKDAIVGCIDCEQIYLFGSYAYGTPTADSDYDFYVVLKDDSALKPMEATGTVYHRLLDFETMMPIDVFANYKNRFDDRSKLPSLERKIAREGILLYDQH